MINNQTFDPNQRVLPLLENKEYPSQKYTVERVLKAVLPILSLYQPIGFIVQSATITFELITDIKKCNNTRDITNIAIKVTAIAGLIFKPLITTTLFQIIDVATHLRNAHKAKKYSDKAWELLKAANGIVYIATLYTASPEILMVSLVAQAGFEIYRTYSFANKGMTLEALVQAVLVVVRGRAAYFQVDRVKRNLFGKKITQTEFENILKEANVQKGKPSRPMRRPATEGSIRKMTSGRGILQQSLKNSTQQFFDSFSSSYMAFDIEKELAKRNFSNIIENINLSERFLADYKFCHLQLKGCTLENSLFDNAYFDHVIVTNTTFDHSVLKKATIRDCTFENSSFFRTTILESTMERVNITNCNVDQAIFFGSKLMQLIFKNSTLDEANFFAASVENSRIEDTSLDNTILADSKFELVNSAPTKTKPVIALETDLEFGYPEFVEGVALALKELGATVLFYSYNGTKIDNSKLKDQVDRWALKPQVIAKHLGSKSIAKQLLSLDQPESEIDKIKLFGVNMMRYADGVVIPGGENVNPIFYGMQKEKLENWDSYDHDMVEFALVDAANFAGKNIMGVCRGSQLINVYFGGTLQDVPEQFGFQKLKPVDGASAQAKALIGKIVGIEQIEGVSAHYQASNIIGKGLEVVLEYEGIPKAIVNPNGRVILTQFHPEVFAFVHSNKMDWDKVGPEYDYQLSEENLTANANFYHQFLGQLDQSVMEA